LPEKLEIHHVLWTRADWSKKPIAKQVRQMGAFLVDVSHTNHRLLHASLRPPNVPEHDVLHQMRELALGGLVRVLEELNHPIVDHIEKQLIIINMDIEEAAYKLDTGDYSRE
jgi:hypothetical protein